MWDDEDRSLDEPSENSLGNAHTMRNSTVYRKYYREGLLRLETKGFNIAFHQLFHSKKGTSAPTNCSFSFENIVYQTVAP